MKAFDWNTDDPSMARRGLRSVVAGLVLTGIMFAIYGMAKTLAEQGLVKGTLVVLVSVFALSTAAWFARGEWDE